MRCGPTICFMSDEIKQSKCVYSVKAFHNYLFHILTPFPSEAITAAVAEQGKNREYVRELADSGMHARNAAIEKCDCNRRVTLTQTSA